MIPALERVDAPPMAARPELPRTAIDPAPTPGIPADEPQPSPAPAQPESPTAAATPEQKVEAVKDQLSKLNPKARSGDWGRASAAILSLVDEESRAVDTQLYAWAQSGSRMVMFPAASALEQRGDPRESQRLIQEAADKIQLPNDEETRFRAINDISRLRTPLALPYLEQAAGDPSPAVRLVVAQALAYVKSDRIVPIARSLLEDPSQEVGAAAQEHADHALASDGASGPPVRGTVACGGV
jgi:hypothetical protein